MTSTTTLSAATRDSAASRTARRERTGAAALAGAAAPWTRARAMLRLWRQRAIGRRELTRMDEVMLKDIGLGHAEARHEAGKHFWEA